MLRKLLIPILLLSFFLLVGSMKATWQDEAVPTVEMAEKTQPRTAPERRKIDFYPPVPARLPDLNQGYVFNEARSLADEENAGEGPGEPEVDATIDELDYIGSVISGEYRVGIIAYAEKSADQARAVRRGRPVRAPHQLEDKHVRLAPGETFGGYSVSEVLPDRIVFEKDGLKVEKLLAADKERKPPPPQVQGRNRTQRQSRQSRIANQRRMMPDGRAPAGSGSVPGRPPEPVPPELNGQPGTLIRNSPPRLIRGGDQPSG